MTERCQPNAATVETSDLGSFPQAGVAVIFGASGGIGGALVEAIQAVGRFEHVIAFSRVTSPSIDLLDEASLERAAAFATTRGELRLVVDAMDRCIQPSLPSGSRMRRQVSSSAIISTGRRAVVGETLRHNPKLLCKRPPAPRSRRDHFKPRDLRHRRMTIHTPISSPRPPHRKAAAAGTSGFSLAHTIQNMATGVLADMTQRCRLDIQ